MKQIIILGTAGNCIDILDAINEINRKSSSGIYLCRGFLDDNSIGTTVLGLPVLGSLTDAAKFAECYFINGIGSPTSFLQRPQIISKTQIPEDRFETIIHPTASVSALATIGRGSVVFQNVSICNQVAIGNHVTILPNTVIGHDSRIADYTAIASGACISGNVQIAENCYIGSNCSITGNISIGKRSLIGIGAVVLKSVQDNCVMVGNPARKLRET